MILIASFEFLSYLILITIFYYSLPKKFQKFVLFFSSLFFLGNISLFFLLFALTSSTFNFLFGIIIYKNRKHAWNKIIYYSTLSVNIGVLFALKYLNSIIESINTFKGYNIPIISILIPIGISYYTFQNIGYLYRVFKGMESAEKGFIDYSIFILFFPKILAGPIERSNHFLPQLSNKIVFKNENIIPGLQLILLGLFKKLVIAENIGIVVYGINNNLDDYAGFTIILVFLLQPLHMYFDFSGYTDIALGAAKLFGYNLTDNFNRPFFATNITTFWKRFHISLTRWCHDFIFNIVLYKRRKWKDWGAVYAVFVTFIVVGVWHGLTLNFLIVGLLQAFAISFEYLTRKQRYNFFQHFNPSFSKYFGRFITYLFYSVTLVFFYSPEFSDALLFFNKIFSTDGLIFNWHMFFGSKVKLFLIPLLIVIYMSCEALQENNIELKTFFYNSHYLVRFSFYYLLIYLIIWYGGTQQEFIYFQF